MQQFFPSYFQAKCGFPLYSFRNRNVFITAGINVE